jgi:hypothetical protein
VLDRGYAYFYEKALFVKPTGRLLCGRGATTVCPSRAMLLSSIRTFEEPLSLVARCIG